MKALHIRPRGDCGDGRGDRRRAGFRLHDQGDFEAIGIAPVMQHGIHAGVPGVAEDLRHNLGLEVGWRCEDMELGPADNAPSHGQVQGGEAKREEAGIESSEPTDDRAVRHAEFSSEGLLVERGGGAGGEEVEQAFDEVRLVSLNQQRDVFLEEVAVSRPRLRWLRLKRGSGGRWNKAAEQLERHCGAAFALGAGGRIKLQRFHLQRKAEGRDQHERELEGRTLYVADEFRGALEFVDDGWPAQAGEEERRMAAREGAIGGVVEADVEMGRELSADECRFARAARSLQEKRRAFPGGAAERNRKMPSDVHRNSFYKNEIAYLYRFVLNVLWISIDACGRAA